MITDRYAVFGHPIKHSRSPEIHALFAAQTAQAMTYNAVDVPAECFERAVAQFIDEAGRGFNCTIPLKELAFHRVDSCTSRALRAAAVNTVKVLEDGSLLGDNTDGVGLLRDLECNLGLSLGRASVLILGAGGAVRGILAPLLERKPARVVIANRTFLRAASLAEAFSDLANLEPSTFSALDGQAFDLILNATAASLSGELPELPEGLLNKNAACYDLAYAAVPTPFVRWGQQQGAAFSVDGLGMLVEQAAAAFELWRGVFPETAPVIAKLNAGRDTRASFTVPSSNHS